MIDCSVIQTQLSLYLAICCPLVGVQKTGLYLALYNAQKSGRICRLRAVSMGGLARTAYRTNQLPISLFSGGVFYETAKEVQSHMVVKFLGDTPLNDTRHVNSALLRELSNNSEPFSVSKK